MKHNYRAGVIGLGNIAWRLDQGRSAEAPPMTHVGAYLRFRRTTLVGGCSPVGKERTAFGRAFDVPVFASVEELLEQTRPDVVSICSPLQFHSRQALHCIERNVPMVWLEKPPVGSVRELDGLLEEMEKSGGKTRVLVNYQRRYVEEYQKLRRIYLERPMGSCRGIHIDYSRGLELNGSHMLDILFFILGDDAERSLEWVSSGGGENPSFAVAFRNGLTAMISGMDLPYHCVDISLVFEEGRVAVLHGGMTFMLEEKVEHELFPGFYRLKEKRVPTPAVSGLKDAMEKALEDLVASFEHEREPTSNLRTARSTQMLIAEVMQK